MATQDGVEMNSPPRCRKPVRPRWVYRRLAKGVSTLFHTAETIGDYRELRANTATMPDSKHAMDSSDPFPKIDNPEQKPPGQEAVWHGNLRCALTRGANEQTPLG